MGAAVVGKPKDEQKEDGERAELRRQRWKARSRVSQKWLAGELLEYHRREARPAWWWFFERRDKMTHDELLDDAESIAGLAHVGAPVADKKSMVHTLTFPTQEYKLARGDAPTDPATKESAGTIVAMDDSARTLKLRRGPSLH